MEKRISQFTGHFRWNEYYHGWMGVWVPRGYQTVPVAIAAGGCLISIIPPTVDTWPLLCSGPAVTLWCSAGFFCTLAFLYHRGVFVPQGHLMCLTSQSPADSPWQIKGSQALWKAASLETRIEIDKPQQGIGPLCYQGMMLPGSMLGIRVRAEDEDHNWVLQMAYSRGNDLLATYQNEACPQNTLQLNWQISPAVAGESLLQMNVVISMHTESLESFPRLTAKTELTCDLLQYVVVPQVDVPDTIRSKTTADQTLRDSPDRAQQSSVGPPERIQDADCPGGAVYRLRDLPWSYAEMVYPADFGHWQGIQTTRIRSHEDPGGRGWISRWDLSNGLLEKGVIRRQQLRALLLPRQNDLSHARRALEKFALEKPRLTS